jgi:glycosyltransferase involved in cell wall biosynthesis
MRIFTCTPVAFGGGADFFARDSGLLCRGLQAVGIDSRAVMPGERKPEDQDDLIRTDYPNLESAKWWRAQQLDGVVLYAWGRPRFRKVAAAIREAGIFLILNLDSGGPMSPLAGWSKWLQAQWVYGGQGRGCASWWRTLRLVLRGITAGLLYTDPMRARHLRCGNVIASVSPGSAEFWRSICRAYGGDPLAERVTVLPHAVEPVFRHNGQAKLRQVACVGRWHDTVQKRAWLLMEVIGRLLETDRCVTVVIAGAATPAMEAWHRRLPHDAAARVRLAGKVGREELARIYQQSQVFYSPSAHESFGIAVAEALCCGCSVVGARKITLPSFEWFVSENSGRLTDDDHPGGHTAVLLAELRAWDEGMRDPQAISTAWCQRLHADQVARRVVEMVMSRGYETSPTPLHRD